MGIAALPFVAFALAQCGSDGTGAACVDCDAGADAIVDAAADGGADATADASADAHVASATTAVISKTHRYIAGAQGMFGGWGPHLGHLVRSKEGDLWFADDSCDDSGAGACDVLVNRRLDYHRFANGAWTRAKSQPLPSGVQQNTGTIVDGASLATYGVNTSTSRFSECRFVTATMVASCSDVPIALASGTNYVGAAISPAGYKVVWATTVQDGGGGSFGWIVDYGGGFNGPRTGPIGGYNDASYIHAAFYGGARASEIAMHAQLVSGLAPNWTFTGAVGDVDTASSNAVTFAVLAPAGSDAAISTDDIAIDPATNDAHMIARTQSGAAAYYFRAAGKSWGAPSFVLPKVYRARLIVLEDGRLALVYGPNGKGLAYRIAAMRAPGVAVDWAATPEVALTLPNGYANVYAIYTEAAVYQRAFPKTLNVAIVGDANQREVLHVAIDP